jgi:site-specific recombinase XerD
MIERSAITADLGIKAHAHCATPAANDGIDTQALQAYLGHRNIQNTTRYTRWRRIALRVSGGIDTAPAYREWVV